MKHKDAVRFPMWGGKSSRGVSGEKGGSLMTEMRKAGDAGYGDNPKFLDGLEERKLLYVCAVERSFGVRLPEEVREAAAATPEKPKRKGRPKLPRPAPLYTVDAVITTWTLPRHGAV